MNGFNIYKNKEEKNNKTAIFNNNRYTKYCLLSQDQNKQKDSKIKIVYNIDKIKMKYGFFSNKLNTYSRIQMLKNKYLNIYNSNNNTNNRNNRNNSNIYNNITFKLNSYKTANLDNLSINKKSKDNIAYSNINNNEKYSTHYINKNSRNKNLFRNSSLQLVKVNNISFNDYFTQYSKIKKDKLNENDKNKTFEDKKNINFNNSNHINNNNKKLSQKFKYLKNTRDEYIMIEKKFNEIINNDLFNKNKKKNFNVIFPISKKINMLNEVKNDIKKLNKKSFDNKLLTPKKDNSFYSTHHDNMRNYSQKKDNFFDELFNDEKEDKNFTNYDSKIVKPILIKSFPKPKLNVPNYINF